MSPKVSKLLFFSLEYLNILGEGKETLFIFDAALVVGQSSFTRLQYPPNPGSWPGSKANLPSHASGAWFLSGCVH